jgi:putative FmdB family regulatory protein
MPTYEYGCKACGHEWELVQRMSEDPKRKCPSCGKMKAQRLISGGNFILKGGGWYADGYGSSPKGESKGADAGSGASETKAEKGESTGKAESSGSSGSSDGASAASAD